MSKSNWLRLAILLAALTGCGEMPASAPEPVAAAPEPATASAPEPVIAAPVAAAAPKPVTAAAPAPVSRAEPIMAGGESKEYGYTSAQHIPARSYCLPHDSCEHGYAAYGYILFTKAPAPNSPTLNRYKAICAAFINNLASADELLRNHISASQIATTFWLLKRPPQHVDNCDELIANYDYDRAITIATSVNKLSSAGPLLIAKSHWNSNESSSTTLLIDLGRFSIDDLDSGFRIWRDKISRDKRYWNNGINKELVIAEFRSFIQKYGGMIIQIIKEG